MQHLATLGETRATRRRTDVDDPNCQGIVPFRQAWCRSLPTLVLWRAAADEGPANVEVTMRIAGFLAAAGLGLVLAVSVAASGARAQGGPSGFQGAWLAGGAADCAEVYSSAGKGASFKKPVDIFAPAFIVAGNRLRTPQ